MASHHRVGIFALVGVIAILSLSVFFIGSPQTGLASRKSNYLTTSAGVGEDVAIEAAKICYPEKNLYTSYRECCSNPCIEQCTMRHYTEDIRVCQMVCQQSCVRIVSSIYLEKRPGFVGKATTMGSPDNSYVVYDN